MGYNLTKIPNRLIPFELTWNLKTKYIAKKVLSFKKVKSTNDVACELANNGIKEGTIVVSEEQSGGKGRLGRRWVSPAHKGIYMSIILRPNIPPVSSPELTLIGTLAVCGAIRKLTGLSSFIKWPNDVIINNKKVCGILTEMSAEVDKVKFLVIGMGVNVNTSKKQLHLKDATSIMEELGYEESRIELTKLILLRFDELYDTFKRKGFSSILSEIKKFSATLNRRVRVHYLDRFIEGHVQNIDKDGALVIRRDSGFIEKVYSGDIVNIR